MNWDTIEGTWKEMSGRAKAKWGDITGDDWASISGRREEIVGLVQKTYGKARDEAEREVDDWFRQL
ncbi:MAG: CsbD family protein [Paracoccaceae bacterium]|nr:MAG: CsbD family protein [Paracoccaceae bacterium]